MDCMFDDYEPSISPNGYDLRFLVSFYPSYFTFWTFIFSWFFKLLMDGGQLIFISFKCDFMS